MKYEILTYKVVVAGKKCRLIKGFSGFLEDKNLPENYENGCYVYLDRNKRSRGRHFFNEEGEMDWECGKVGVVRDVLCLSLSEHDFDVGDFIFCGIQTGSVWPEETFQKIVASVKKATDRLDNMVMQSWSGEDVVEI